MREIYGVIALLIVPTLAQIGSAMADTPTAAREECLTHLDLLHRCACNDIRGESPVDLGAFNLNRPDIQAAYQDFKKSDHYSADQDSRLVTELKAAFNEQREQLACHDKVAVRLGDFIQAESYSAEPRSIERATQVVTERVVKNWGTFDQELGRMSYCSPQKIQPLTHTRVIAIEYPPCKIDLKSLFPDNHSALTPAQVNKIVRHIQDHACYQQYLRNGLDLQKIEISSSSSLLANTGEATQKSFAQLSQERADEIADKIVADVFDPSIFTRVKYDKNARGVNGDGTSGACPYAYDGKKRNWIRKPFPTNAQLEASKKTELNFYFGANTKQVDSNAYTDLMAVPCRRVQFYCHE